MSGLKRFGLVCVLVLAVGASFGCSKKNVSSEGMGEGENYGNGAYGSSMTIVDQAAQAISDRVVYFDYDKYDIQPQYYDMLRENADMLKQHSSIRVRIEGHCDERGTEEYNLALGGRRARTVYDYLMRLGVNPAQMEIISYGKERPAVMGTGPAAWDKNRRAYFQIVSR